MPARTMLLLRTHKMPCSVAPPKAPPKMPAASAMPPSYFFSPNPELSSAACPQMFLPLAPGLQQPLHPLVWKAQDARLTAWQPSPHPCSGLAHPCGRAENAVHNIEKMHPSEKIKNDGCLNRLHTPSGS